MGTKNSCKTAAVMGLIGRGPATEAAPPMPVERARDIETITSEILDAKRAGGEAILTIGKGLIEAKALLSHGEWLPWLTEKVEFSESSAQRFMRLAREWSNPSTLTDLGASKALQLLALPEAEREEFLGETHEVNGEEKAVIDMSARELAQAIKELNELRSRPVDVAVESDPAAIEAARKEAETAMQDKLNEARAAQEKARADLMEVNNALQRAKLEREQVEIELRKQLAQVEKKASLNANEDFVLFKTILGRFREDGNRLCGLILKKRDKDQKMAEGFSNAFFTSLDDLRKEAQG